jgi:hypothetical protein
VIAEVLLLIVGGISTVGFAVWWKLVVVVVDLEDVVVGWGLVVLWFCAFESAVAAVHSETFERAPGICTIPLVIALYFHVPLSQVSTLNPECKVPVPSSTTITTIITTTTNTTIDNNF